MSEEVEQKPKKAKKWPKEYYATRFECKSPYYRHASVAGSRRKGFVGWRKKDNGCLA